MFPPLEQVALEREEILLELHEGRKAEEEAFKEQREMEDNIKRRLLLRWIELSTTQNMYINNRGHHKLTGFGGNYSPSLF